MLHPLKKALYIDAEPVKPLKAVRSVHGLPGPLPKESGLHSVRPWPEFSCQPFGSPCTCDMCSRLNRMRSSINREM
jgi:hypothetical protein